MIAIIDYGMGNLRSVQKACEYVGYDARITADKQTIRDASHVILPGVGAARDALQNLRERGLFDEAIRRPSPASRFWASAWECSFCLTEVWKTGNTNAWAWCPERWFPFA